MDFLNGFRRALSAFFRTVQNMGADDIAAWASIGAAFFAAIGLFYAGRQTLHSVRSSELDHLVRMQELVRASLKDHTNAYNKQDTALMASADIDVINLMELFAVSIRRKLVHGAAYEFSMDYLVSLLAFLEQYNRDAPLKRPNNQEEFKHVRWVMQKHRKKVDDRKKNIVEAQQNAQASITQPPSPTPPTS